MNPRLWRLSGPALFLDRLVERARAGASTLALLGEDAPDDAPQQLAQALRTAEIPVYGLDPALPPIPQIAALLPQVAHGEPTLDVVCAACHGPRCFVVDLAAAEQCPPWSQFLQRLQHRARQNAAGQRPTVVLFRRGAWLGEPPKPDVALEVVRWERVISEADFLAYAHALAAAWQRPALEHRLLVHTLAAVALWDLELMERLSREPPRDLLAPHTALAAYARERGWTAATTLSAGNGTWAQIGGRGLEHSAYLVIRGAGRGVDQRIWEAQARILLPWVEEMRQARVADVTPWVAAKLGREERVEDLEIGPTHHWLRQTAAPPSLQTAIRMLKTVRDRLAHRGCLNHHEVRALLALDVS